MIQNPIIMIAVGYGGMLLSLPILGALGRVVIVKWLDREDATRRARLAVIERRHQAADGREYGEE